MDRTLLILATLAFLGGLMHAIVSLRAGTWRENRWHWVPMAVGLVFQYLRLLRDAGGRRSESINLARALPPRLP